MANVPDVGIVNYWRLTPAEIKVWDFYCARRNNETGGWECADQWVANEMRMGRSSVTEARNGLERKGWIKIMYVRDAKYFVAPFFGFVVENSTYLDEISTKLVEISTRPLKELPAQLPTQFTREGADDSAPLAQPDEKSTSQSAGKPAVAAPAKKRKRRRSSAPRPPAGRKPTDITIDHPAVQMIYEISGRFPNKDLWNRISKEIGDKPNAEFFRKSFVKWRSFSGNPMNYEKWLFEPNATGNIPETYGANGFGSGSGKPPDVPQQPEKDRLIPLIPFDERMLAGHLEDFRTANHSAAGLSELKEHFEPAAWAWLMENLKNG